MTTPHTQPEPTDAVRASAELSAAARACEAEGMETHAHAIQRAIALTSDHERALAKEYGRGVSAGKAEALKYTAEEREAYGKHVAAHEHYKSLQTRIASLEKELAQARADDVTEVDPSCLLNAGGER